MLRDQTVIKIETDDRVVQEWLLGVRRRTERHIPETLFGRQFFISNAQWVGGNGKLHVSAELRELMLVEGSAPIDLEAARKSLGG